jgi:hypothetical protein
VKSKAGLRRKLVERSKPHWLLHGGRSHHVFLHTNSFTALRRMLRVRGGGCCPSTPMDEVSLIVEETAPPRQSAEEGEGVALLSVLVTEDHHTGIESTKTGEASVSLADLRARLLPRGQSVRQPTPAPRPLGIYLKSALPRLAC